MTKYEIAAILEEIAFLLELKGENPFKARAYSRAAEILKTLPQEPAALVAERRLDEVKGIGPTLAASWRGKAERRLVAAIACGELDWETLHTCSAAVQAQRRQAQRVRCDEAERVVDRGPDVAVGRGEQSGDADGAAQALLTEPSHTDPR